MSKKILVLGLGQNNFLSYLYGTLKRFNNNFIISAPYYTDLNDVNKDESWMYENEKIKIKSSLFAIILSVFYCLFSIHFYQTFFFILFVEKKIDKAVHFVYKQILSQAFFIDNQSFINYDVFHFHFMQYSYLRELFMVPKGKKIICSFWGSDLLRTSDILNFYFVKKALNRATVITCQSVELREIILSKYGRNLYKKIQVSMFPVDNQTYLQMDNYDNNKEKINEFKKKFGYASNKINVLIGHNGSPMNNHLKIIEALQKSNHFSSIHIIINFNYGINQKDKEVYKNKILNSFSKTPEKPTIIEHFFSKEELALSRLATDVFIHMPISDALSGSMLEMLYASSIVITGSWLPYKTFTSNHLVYHEVANFKEVTKKINEIAPNFEQNKDRIKHNKMIIKNHFLTDSIIKKWDSIFS